LAPLADYRIVKANLFDGGNRSINNRFIPFCLFIDPELVHIGLTETEAHQQGYAIQVAKLDASAIPKAKTLGQTDRVLKSIVDTQTGRILGDTQTRRILGCTLSCSR
jgi:pyruvate/2-oxoglutarate dehydrogenase complex dihydrolipoamide dehydrogenase (E3) component